MNITQKIVAMTVAVFGFVLIRGFAKQDLVENGVETQ